MKTPDGHFIAHSELEWATPLPIRRVVDPVVAQYLMQLRDALRWALGQIEDDLDPDHQAALEAARSLIADAPPDDDRPL